MASYHPAFNQQHQVRHENDNIRLSHVRSPMKAHTERLHGAARRPLLLFYSRSSPSQLLLLPALCGFYVASWKRSPLASFFDLHRYRRSEGSTQPLSTEAPC